MCPCQRHLRRLKKPLLREAHHHSVMERTEELVLNADKVHMATLSRMFLRIRKLEIEPMLLPKENKKLEMPLLVSHRKILHLKRKKPRRKECPNLTPSLQHVMDSMEQGYLNAHQETESEMVHQRSGKPDLWLKKIQSPLPKMRKKIHWRKQLRRTTKRMKEELKI